MSRRAKPKKNLEPRPSDERRLAGVVAVRTDPAPAERSHALSPHLLDLKGAAAQRPRAGDDRSGSGRQPRWKWKQKLDERLHLHDLRVRTLSVRPRGWKDFPPTTARTVGHAFIITVVKFFREHPLAELTIITVVHLFVLAVWKITSFPFRSLVPRPGPENAGAKEKLRPLPSLPLLAAVPVRTKTTEPTTAKRPAALAFDRPPGWRRSLLAFAVIATMFVLPVGVYSSIGTVRNGKTAVMNRAVRGMESLQVASAAAQERKFEEAGEAFNQAFLDFTEAQSRMGPFGSAAASAAAILPIRTQLAAADPLLTAGREIASGGADLAEGFAALDCALDPAAKIAALRSYLETSLPHLERAAKALAKVSPKTLPEQYRGTFASAQGQMPKLVDGVRRAVDVTSLLRDLMGADGIKRYLVIFQNNAELRPTGGFIGSFALIDVNRGSIKKVEIPGGGSYDLKGSLRARLVSPRPLHLINPDWEFQDANWFADFPTSAKKVTWFYEKSGGPTTDGVIAVNASFMEKVLELTGPIDMPEYGKTIDARNFYFETQKAVELEYDKAQNQPKKFIADLAPKVLERVLAADQNVSLQLIDALDRSLSQKDLLFWFRDAAVQSKAAALGWTGEIKGAEGDYLNIVHTNIAGQKTDLVMKDDVDYSVKILPDGTGIATLTIKRTHTGTKNALFSGVRNVDFMRVYVPYGSTLIEASGFSVPDPKLFKITDTSRTADPDVAEQEDGTKIDRASGVRISTESGKTVFGNWVQTDPGQTSIVTMVYKLPPGTIRYKKLGSGKITALYDLIAGRGERQGLAYSLLLQKQPGANPATLTSRIDFPRGYRIIWQAPARAEDDRGRWSVSRTLERDELFGAIAQIN